MRRKRYPGGVSGNRSEGLSPGFSSPYDHGETAQAFQHGKGNFFGGFLRHPPNHKEMEWLDKAIVEIRYNKWRKEHE